MPPRTTAGFIPGDETQRRTSRSGRSGYLPCRKPRSVKRESSRKMASNLQRITPSPSRARPTTAGHARFPTERRRPFLSSPALRMRLRGRYELTACLRFQQRSGSECNGMGRRSSQPTSSWASHTATLVGPEQKNRLRTPRPAPGLGGKPAVPTQDDVAETAPSFSGPTETAASIKRGAVGQR